MTGTSVDVDAFAEAYRELPLNIGSTRLDVDAFAKPLRSTCAPIADFPGDGAPLLTLLSLSFESVMFFGLENSFILELLLFASLSVGSGGTGGGGGGGMSCEGGGKPGEGSGLLP